MPFDYTTHCHVGEIERLANKAVTLPTMAARRDMAMQAFDLAKRHEYDDLVCWQDVAEALAAVIPAPRKTAKPKEECLDHLTTRLANVSEHDAEPGFDVPRYSPPGFPFPLWSDADLARPDARRFGKTGNLLLQDRRKPWQKETRARFDKTGSICTSMPS